MTVYRHKPGARMSQAVRVGNIVFLAGQIPQDLTGDIAAQTREVLDGIDRVMKELGGNKSNVVSVQVWLSDMSDFQGMNSVWDEWVDKENPPARATGGVALARPGMRVEMIATAHL
jgi:enamine deaminase RidA (YjgF/YER057c/UK114 family)